MRDFRNKNVETHSKGFRLTGIPKVMPHAYPMDELYAEDGQPLPDIEVIGGHTVPPPFHGLLVHTRDMTQTLEQHRGMEIHLRVLRRRMRDDTYLRESLLLLEDGDTVVEFGAIRINLDFFPPPARRAILEEHFPLGHLLHEYRIPFESRPKAFLRIHTDAFMNGLFGLTGSHTLYGRRNTLMDGRQQVLAEVVEILPPMPSNP